MDKISVIIPVYNAENYLKECLNSICNQTYKNLEIICINDGSIDDSLQILEEFSKEDKRIKVFSQENQGTSVARNKGLELACGKYVAFVDADDWLDLSLYEVAVSKINQHKVDIVTWPYIREFEKESKKRKLFKKSEIAFYEQDYQKKFYKKVIGITNEELIDPSELDIMSSTCNKLYPLELIQKEQIRFIDLAQIGTAEDLLFNVQVLAHLHSAYYTEQINYHYRKNNPNSITSVYKVDLYDKWLFLFDLIKKELQKHSFDKDFTDALNNRIALSIVGGGLNIIFSEFDFGTKEKKIREILTCPTYSEAITNLSIKKMPIHWKLFFCFAKKKFALGVTLLLFIIKKIVKK